MSIESISWQQVASLLREDAEFRIAARFWTATLRLDSGPSSVALKLENGHLRDLAHSAASAPADVAIGALPADWERLLEATPRPFYQDLFGAMMHHGFTVEGDEESFYAYYPAIRRLIEVVRQARTR